MTRCRGSGATSRAGYAVVAQAGSTTADLEALPGARTWDVVIADYHLPGFTGLEALALVRGRSVDDRSFWCWG